MEKDETISSPTKEHQRTEHDEVEEKSIETVNEQRRDPALGSTIRPTNLLPPKNKKRRYPENDEVDKGLLRALQTPQQEHHPDEDELFFAPLLLCVRRLAPDEKLQFRVDVLQLIQKTCPVPI